MTGFEPQTSGVESKRSTNWATSTSQAAQVVLLIQFLSFNAQKWRRCVERIGRYERHANDVVGRSPLPRIGPFAKLHSSKFSPSHKERLWGQHICVLASHIEQSNKKFGSRHSSVVLPTIQQPQVRIPSTPSKLFSICIIEIEMRKGGK